MLYYRGVLQVAVPSATIQAGGAPATAGTSSHDATASDSAALSRRFLEEWQGEGCPGKPPPTAKRPLAPERKTVVATHSLYNRTAGGDTVSAARASVGGEQAVEGECVVVESPMSAKKPRKLSAEEMCVVGSRRGCHLCRVLCCFFCCCCASGWIYSCVRWTGVVSYDVLLETRCDWCRFVPDVRRMPSFRVYGGRANFCFGLVGLFFLFIFLRRVQWLGRYGWLSAYRGRVVQRDDTPRLL